MLLEQELKKYSSHVVLEEIGEEGQEKLKNAKILIIGIGGLGSPSALYLAASGIGTLGLVDFDTVEENDLQRQIIHSIKDLKKSKLESAKESILNLNKEIKLNLHDIRINEDNIELINDYDLVIDCTDNLQVRYSMNDACLKFNKPLIYGGISKFEGQVSVFNYKNGPCFRCFIKEDKRNILNCNETGVLSSIPGVIGTIEATEALKIILDKGKVLSGRLLFYDALNSRFREIKINKQKDCKCNKN
ncbi:MAG: HesA/MoeB/ThiF family protein [Candidatus Nanoarchaeia archaeon]|jgi:adenylyltransferase/sulfurtransferase|nr:HesA/MoeB/ThiF family protein [Candidatus Nanoarchaeia archaeon]|tara:strand:- start:10915 stop:11652 length:738 start_codon:yes stop_codon:yes gene_type:complete